MSSMELKYAGVRLGLRAPRVAVVFNGAAAHWHFFARLALWQSTHMWGGSGFILVPHVGGVVSPAMLRASVAYDPDYVVVSPITMGDLEAAEPGWAARTITDFDKVPADQVEAFMARLAITDAVDDDTLHARAQVARACSPHRRRLEPDDVAAAAAGFVQRWDEDLQSLQVESAHIQTTHTITPVSVLAGTWPICLAAPPDLDGPLGAAVTGKIGAIERPAFEGTEPSARDVASMIRWFVDRRAFVEELPASFVHQPGQTTVSVRPEDLDWAWSARSVGLMQIAEGPLPPAVTLVVGETADDFALALALERVQGVGIWIHPDWDPTGATSKAEAARAGLEWLRNARTSSRTPLTVTSVSLPADALIEQRDYVDSLRARPRSGIAGARTRTQAIAPLSTDIDWDGPRKQHVGIEGRYDIPTFMPMLSDGDTRTFATELAAIVPNDPELATNHSVTWQVDVRLVGSKMPTGRGLDGHQLVVPGADEYETWVRPSRAGISFHSVRYSGTFAAETKEQTLARPELRVLGLTGWVEAMARQADLEAGLSDLGRRADILARLWGSRDSLAAGLAGPLWPALDAFMRKPKGKQRNSDVYPAGEGVFITGFGGYLTFEGIANAVGTELDLDSLRDTLDELLRKTILRRGLVLSCADCRHLAFFSVDELAQSNTCGRCNAAIDLNRGSWSSKPATEPRWFYDLHGVGRNLLDDNGHAPLWLDHMLARDARQYASIAETNLYKPGTRKSLGETDLVAIADGTLVTAEVKTSNFIGKANARQDAARKRVLWADVIRADAIVLATTHERWAPSSVAAMRKAMREHAWTPGHEPQLRLVTGLGMPSARSEVQEL